MENQTRRTVIIVHSIGKVASSSVYLAATKSCKDASVFHTHFLNEKRVVQVSAKMKDHGRVLSGHIKDSLEVIPLLDDSSINFKVITLVRDPFARSISAFFENIEMFGLDKKALPSVDATCEIFKKAYPINSLDEWFASEFCSVFSVRLLEHPFPKRLGWYCFEKENFDFLLMKAELSNSAKQAVVSAFLGCPDLKIGSDNVMADKFNAEYYSNFKKQLDGRVEDKLSYYDSEYMKLFYSIDEMIDFHARAVD